MIRPRIKMLRHIYDIIHIITAAFFAYASPCALVAATIAYIYYQHTEREPWEDKAGDIVEWLLGAALGLLIKIIYTCIA